MTIDRDRSSIYNSLVQLYRRRNEISKLADSLSQSFSNSELRALNAQISRTESRLISLNLRVQPQQIKRGRREKLEVLIVEDNPGDAFLARLMFRGEKGFELSFASRVSSALEKLSNPFDVVLLD